MSSPILSDDEDDAPSPGAVKYAIVNQRLAKRAQAASYLSLVATFDSESIAPSRRTKNNRGKQTQICCQNADPETELANSIARIKATTSSAYTGYSDPTLIYEDDRGVRFHVFECLRCNNHTVRQRVGITETAQFMMHNVSCVAEKLKTLDTFGITSGTKKLTPKQSARTPEIAITRVDSGPIALPTAQRIIPPLVVQGVYNTSQDQAGPSHRTTLEVVTDPDEPTIRQPEPGDMSVLPNLPRPAQQPVLVFAQPSQIDLPPSSEGSADAIHLLTGTQIHRPIRGYLGHTWPDHPPQLQHKVS
ncbi:hypothetical protein BDV93DRAFT_564946 [Ceratobasidium sp. AG-I]|nr:hypothetical protein BDV93DRAFT_564946 [Ceratobasidium sp. AG-I]